MLEYDFTNTKFCSENWIIFLMDLRDCKIIITYEQDSNLKENKVYSGFAKCCRENNIKVKRVARE